MQQQAGHASVKMTVDVYGSWFAVEAPGAMARLPAGAPEAGRGNNLAESGNKAADAETDGLLPTGTCARPGRYPSFSWLMP